MEWRDSSDDELEMLEDIEPLPITRCVLKRKNPFDQLEDEQFRMRYRLSKPAVLKILCEVEDKLEYASDRNYSVSPINQLLITLRFLATGTFQLIIGDSFGIDKSTVSRIIGKLIPIIASLSKTYVKIPNSQDDRKEIMQSFYRKAGFLGIIGALDCTHVPIFSPGGDDAEAYRNRKGFFSFNVQLICDPNLYIMDVVERWPGSAHDSNIFDSSHKFAMFETNEIPAGCLVGDSGYPCRNYLLTPVSNPTTLPQVSYNKAHVQARNCIERVNGVLKRRFPALKYGIRNKTTRIPAIIFAAVVLHNIAVILKEDDPPVDVELSKFIEARRKSGMRVDYDDPEDFLPPDYNGPGNTAHRTALINDFFT